uniref:Uncharacterized protein n=1 Tax=Glossina pallidipes TaxID=7398 RepID=A0A1B0A295_GLOPL
MRAALTLLLQTRCRRTSGPSFSGPFSGINCSSLSELSYVISSNSTCVPTFVPQLDQEKIQAVNLKEVSGEMKPFNGRLSQSMEDLTLISDTWPCKPYEPSRLISSFSVNNLFTSIRKCSYTGLRDTSGLSSSQTRHKYVKRSSDPRYCLGTSRLGVVKRRLRLRNSVNNSYASSHPLGKKGLKRAAIASRRQSFSSLSNGDANDSGYNHFTISSVSGLRVSSRNNKQNFDSNSVGMSVDVLSLELSKLSLSCEDESPINCMNLIIGNDDCECVNDALINDKKE